jgi:hypothetical protein
VYEQPFYLHAGLGIHLGGLALGFEIGELPPPGYVFYDPYCDRTFASLRAYRHYLHRYGGYATLTLVPVEPSWSISIDLGW